MDNLIIIAVLFIIVGFAIWYIVKAKKSGNKCIGCPHKCCPSKDGVSCQGCSNTLED